MQLHHRLDMHVHVILEAVGRGLVMLEPLVEGAREEFRPRRRRSALVREAEATHRDAELLPHVVHHLLVVHAGAFPSPRLGVGGLHESLRAVHQVEI